MVSGSFFILSSLVYVCTSFLSANFFDLLLKLVKEVRPESSTSSIESSISFSLIAWLIFNRRQIARLSFFINENKMAKNYNNINLTKEYKMN